MNELLENREFKGIKKLLNLLFPIGFEVENYSYEKGEYYSFDGLGGYLKKPTLELILKANNKRYKLNFHRDYQLIGPCWYWEAKEKGYSGTCFFENYDNDKIIETFNKKDYINKLFKFEI